MHGDIGMHWMKMNTHDRANFFFGPTFDLEFFADSRVKSQTGCV